MTLQQTIGKRGERLARSFLEKKGYQILETNWRFKRAEIDIIAKDGSVLVFVEVKTRSTDHFGEPEEFLTPHQWELISDAGGMYMEEINHLWEVRFDIVSVLIRPSDQPRIKHVKDAYFPGEE